MKKLKSGSKFFLVEELVDSFYASLGFKPTDFGFIQPGHGLKEGRGGYTTMQI